MADIRVSYDRKLTDADISAILRRANTTLSVLQQLGKDYQNLPGYAMADLQAQAKTLADNLGKLQDLISQLVPLLETLDNQGAPLDASNKALLQLLRGLLAGKAELQLLDQITGPTTQAPRPPITPAP